VTTCARCATFHPPRTTSADLESYWGDPLCRPCARTVADLLDEHDKWPPVPWTDADEEVIR
jgi:hypothetical protein